MKVGTRIKIVVPFALFKVGETGYVAEIENEDARKQAWCKVCINDKNQTRTGYVLLTDGKSDNIKEI